MPKKMNTGIHLTLVFALIFGVSFASALEEKPAFDPATKPTRQQIMDFYNDPQGVVFTEWTDLWKDYANWQVMTDAGLVPTRNEARVKNGRTEYRKGYKSFKKVHPQWKMRWYCYGGKSPSEFDAISRDLFVKGFFIIAVQTLVDSDGDTLCQALWANPECEKRE